MSQVGEEWIYRLRDSSPSERVLILEVNDHERRHRRVIQFLDGDKAGTVEDVPAKRLREPWENVTAYDTLMENWQRIDDADLTDTERYAVDHIFRWVIPSQVAELIHRPVEKAVRVYHLEELERLTGLTINDLCADYENFHHDGDLILPPNAGMVIAEHACRTTPDSVLARIIDEETAVRNRIKHGTNRFGDPTHSELRAYQEYDRPRHELIRSWCGHRQVSQYERLQAAEAENARLMGIIKQLFEVIDRLDGKDLARHIARDYWENQITEGTYRPTIQEPPPRR